MSKHGDIGAPSSHRGRVTATLLLVPLGLMALWAVTSPFLHPAAVPTATRVAAGQ